MPLMAMMVSACFHNGEMNRCDSIIDADSAIELLAHLCLSPAIGHFVSMQFLHG